MNMNDEILNASLSFDRYNCKRVPKKVLQDGGSKRCTVFEMCAVLPWNFR